MCRQSAREENVMKIKETIGMAAHTYLTHKKITIPASVAIVALIVGGICFGVYSNPQPKHVKTTTTAKATPEYMSYAKAGTYDSKAHYTSGSISSDGVTISNATFDTLEITSDVGEGTIHLKNVTVKDTILVNGGVRTRSIWNRLPPVSWLKMIPIAILLLEKALKSLK